LLEIYFSVVATLNMNKARRQGWTGFADTLEAPLEYAFNPITKPVLVIFRESFDRLIEDVHQSIYEDKISVFDQAQINSFIAGRSGKHDHMLMVKLGQSTFRAYKGIWKHDRLHANR
jgi:hypothetical protein